MDYDRGFSICDNKFFYMRLKMYIDNEKINEAIKRSGLKKKWIAEQLDITYNSLRRKLKGEIHFNKLELEKLRSILEKYL